MLNAMSKRPSSFVRSSTGYRMNRPSVSASACIVTFVNSNRLFVSVNDEPFPRSAETPCALPLDVTDTGEYKRDHVAFLELEVDAEPPLEIDRREVVWAGFIDQEAALRLPVTPMVRAYLNDAARRRAGAPR